MHVKLNILPKMTKLNTEANFKSCSLYTLLIFMRVTDVQVLKKHPFMLDNRGFTYLV